MHHQQILDFERIKITIGFELEFCQVSSSLEPNTFTWLLRPYEDSSKEKGLNSAIFEHGKAKEIIWSSRVD